jgi:hypothetical protein
MEVVGLTWDRHVWPLATGGAARLQPASTKQAWPVQARAVALEAQQHPHEHAEHRARRAFAIDATLHDPGVIRKLLAHLGMTP